MKLKYPKKYVKTIGMTGCVLTMLSYLLLLLIGAGKMRVEYSFVIHTLIPTTTSKLFVFAWVFYYAVTNEYDNASRIFARCLLGFLVFNMIFTFFDYEMYFFILMQSATSTLILIFTILLIKQRRFAIRSKKYAANLRIIDIMLTICMISFAFLILVSFAKQYVYLFSATVVSQIFTMIAIHAVADVEKKFELALKAGVNDSEEVEYSD